MSVSLKGRSIVSDVSLSLESGTVCALLGHNGAGKTTLLRALVGLIKPSTGRVSYDAEPVAVFENPRYPSDVTVRQILEHHSRRTGVVANEAIIEALGVARLLDKRGNALSAGMRQRLSLVIGTMSRASVLLIDEPTLGLDLQGTRQLMAMVRDLSSRGYAVVLSSHDLAELEGVCQYIVCMREGRTTYSGTVRDAAAAVIAPSQVIRTTDDDAAFRALAQARVPVSQVAGGLRLECSASLAATFKRIESVAAVLEVTVERGLFSRVYDKYASLPDAEGYAR